MTEYRAVASDAPEFTPTEWEILRAIKAQMDEAAEAPEPVDGDRWEREDWQDVRRYGPMYLPRHWFNDGKAMPERVRVRFLRVLYLLMGSGLVEGTAGENGRLKWVKLTAAGLKALAPQKKAAPKKRKRSSGRKPLDGSTREPSNVAIETPAATAPTETPAEGV